MIWQLLAIVLLSVASAVAYRCGGSGNYGRWVRPVGCSICLILALLALGMFHWSLILCFGIQYGAVTTYFKKKGSDAKWWNWLLVGVAGAVVLLPLMFFDGNWLAFAIRSVVLVSGTVLWSQFIGNAVWEECGRGALIILSLLPFVFLKPKKGQTK